MRTAPLRKKPEVFGVGACVQSRDRLSLLALSLLVVLGVCFAAAPGSANAAETILPVGTEAQTVVPNADATRPGSAATDSPFLGVNNSYRLQVYDASQFAPLKDGAYLTGVSFRMEEGQGAPFDVT